MNALPEEESNKQWFDRNDKARANKIRAIVLTGVSAYSGGDIMYRFEDSGSTKSSRRNSHQSHTDPDSIGVVCRRLTKAEEVEYTKRRAAFDDSREALDTWINEHKIPDVGKFLEEKIQEQIDAMPQEEAETETEDPREAPKSLRNAPLRDSRFDGVKGRGRRRR